MLSPNAMKRVTPSAPANVAGLRGGTGGGCCANSATCPAGGTGEGAVGESAQAATVAARPITTRICFEKLEIRPKFCIVKCGKWPCPLATRGDWFGERCMRRSAHTGVGVQKSRRAVAESVAHRLDAHRG